MYKLYCMEDQKTGPHMRKKTPKEFVWVDEWAEELMGKWKAVKKR